jgi:hypothetical protein
MNMIISHIPNGNPNRALIIDETNVDVFTDESHRVFAELAAITYQVQPGDVLENYSRNQLVRDTGYLMEVGGRSNIVHRLELFEFILSNEYFRDFFTRLIVREHTTTSLAEWLHNKTVEECQLVIDYIDAVTPSPSKSFDTGIHARWARLGLKPIEEGRRFCYQFQRRQWENIAGFVMDYLTSDGTWAPWDLLANLIGRM